MIRALGVDLGLQGAGGLAVVEDGPLPRLLHTVALPERQSGLDFLEMVKGVLSYQHPDLVVCEKPWTGRRDPRPKIGMAQRERLGLVRLACERFGLPKSRLKLIPASTMKRMVTGNGRASKEEVASIAGSIVGVKLDNQHVADAVGLALCALQQERTRKADQRVRREIGLTRRVAPSSVEGEQVDAW